MTDIQQTLAKGKEEQEKLREAYEQSKKHVIPTEAEKQEIAEHLVCWHLIGKESETRLWVIIERVKMPLHKAKDYVIDVNNPDTETNRLGYSQLGLILINGMEFVND